MSNILSILHKNLLVKCFPENNNTSIQTLVRKKTQNNANLPSLYDRLVTQVNVAGRNIIIK